jgi:hypothetical protein
MVLDNPKKKETYLPTKDYKDLCRDRQVDLKKENQGREVAGWKVRGKLGFFLDIPAIHWLAPFYGVKPILFHPPTMNNLKACPFGCDLDKGKSLNPKRMLHHFRRHHQPLKLY